MIIIWMERENFDKTHKHVEKGAKRLRRGGYLPETNKRDRL